MQMCSQSTGIEKNTNMKCAKARRNYMGARRGSETDQQYNL